MRRKRNLIISRFSNTLDFLLYTFFRKQAGLLAAASGDQRVHHVPDLTRKFFPLLLEEDRDCTHGVDTLESESISHLGERAAITYHVRYELGSSDE